MRTSVLYFYSLFKAFYLNKFKIGYISAGFNGDKVAQDLVLFMKNNNIDPANTYCIGNLTKTLKDIWNKH